MRRGVCVELGGGGSNVADQERARDVGEVPLDPDRVGVDEHEVPGLQRAIAGLQVPRVGVRARDTCPGDEVLATAAQELVGEFGEQIDLADPGRGGGLEPFDHRAGEPRVVAQQDQFLGGLDGPGVERERLGVVDLEPAPLQRRERRRGQAVDPQPRAIQPPRPQRLGDLVRPERDRGLGIVGVLPLMHRTDVLDDPTGDVGRAGMLEQDRIALDRNQRAPHVVPQAIRRHDRRAGRVSDVRRLEEQAGILAVVAHRPLQPSEPSAPKRFEFGYRSGRAPLARTSAETLRHPRMLGCDDEREETR